MISFVMWTIIRNFLQVQRERWSWNGEHISFKTEWEEQYLASNVSDQLRTTNEICKAIVKFQPHL